MNQDSENKTKLSQLASLLPDAEQAGCFLGGSLFLGGVCVLVYQCYLWLVYGEWIPFSAQGGFEFVLGPDYPFVQWLNNPQSWYGLHRIVDFLTGSLSIFLFVLGWVIFWVTELSSSPSKTPN